MTGPHIPHPRPPLEPITTPPPPVEVGDRRGTGQVQMTLIGVGERQRVTVNVSHMTGMTVDISRQDAVTLYRGLGRLLGLA
jgi:hypothetical protein